MQGVEKKNAELKIGEKNDESGGMRILVASPCKRTPLRNVTGNTVKQVTYASSDHHHTC